MLSSFGLKPLFAVHKTGVIARLHNGTGSTVVLRADLDALPVQELNHVSFRSKNTGVMHACGHDVHTACLLGAAQALVKMRAWWHGTVVFVFQPSEECEPGGALSMMRQRAFPASADAVFGLHVSPDLPTGAVGIKAGADCAGVMDFDVIVHGRGGHGAFPQKTIDPILCAAQIALALQRVAGRKRATPREAVLSIGSFMAGAARNVIPDAARLSGTIRTFSPQRQKTFGARVAALTSAIARARGARAEVHLDKSYPPLINDPSLTKRAYAILVEALGRRSVRRLSEPRMFSEDFAYYGQKAPALFLHLGVRAPRQKSMPPLHSAAFLPDERSIKTGIAVHAALVMGMMDGQAVGGASVDRTRRDS